MCACNEPCLACDCPSDAEVMAELEHELEALLTNPDTELCPWMDRDATIAYLQNSVEELRETT